MPAPGIDIAGIRTDYRMAALDEAAAGNDPISFFSKWFADAEASHITEVNAMTLATVDEHHNPHARIVLLKGIDSKGFLFFTNYDSAKGHNIASNPSVALVFFWKELERQVRIEGTIEQVTAAESDDYFKSRPVGSRLGAWASPQSAVIPRREVLDERYHEYENKFSDGNIPRPPHWGGYRVMPASIEFWQGRSSRMHDRILFQHEQAGLWRKSRLAP